MSPLAQDTATEPSTIVQITGEAMAQLQELRASEPDADRLGLRLEIISEPGEDFRYDLSFDVVTKGTSPLGEEYAESVAAGVASVMYASRVPHTEATPSTDTTQTTHTTQALELYGLAPGGPPAVAVSSQDVGHGAAARPCTALAR